MTKLQFSYLETRLIQKHKDKLIKSQERSMHSRMVNSFLKQVPKMAKIFRILLKLSLTRFQMSSSKTLRKIINSFLAILEVNKRMMSQRRKNVANKF